jgi:hypothetical protein
MSADKTSMVDFLGEEDSRTLMRLMAQVIEYFSS